MKNPTPPANPKSPASKNSPPELEREFSLGHIGPVLCVALNSDALLRDKAIRGTPSTRHAEHLTKDGIWPILEL